MSNNDHDELYKSLLTKYFEKKTTTEIDSLLPSHIDVKRISENEWIQTLWTHWCKRLLQTNIGLPDIEPENIEVPEIASQQLNLLLYTLRKTSELDESEIQSKIERYADTQKWIRHGGVGNLFNAVTYLKAAAVMLGCNEDHFIRQTAPGQILRVEGESETAYEVRLQAVTNYHLIHALEPLKTTKKTSKDTFTIRFVWPRMCIKIADAKLVHNSPWAAITKLFCLFDDDFSAEPALVRQTILSADSTK